MASVAHRHAEWLSLLEINGPFLSMGVLLEAFPQGLDAHDSDHAHLLRTFYDEWLESTNSARSDPAVHKAWINFVLKETLGFTDEVLVSGQKIPENLAVHVPRENETLRPSLVLLNPTAAEEPGKARLLIDVLPASQGVEKAMEGHRWKASPASRMLELLKATNTRLGLITNGEQWMLVNAASGESAGYITWTSDYFVEEPLTLRAFRSLLGLRRFFAVSEATVIEALLDASLSDSNEVTDQLGYQVRKAVEVFIQAVDRIDQDRNRELLRSISAAHLYEAALTVMMRLVFLFSAEERGLFLLGEELYDQCYAVSTLRAQLQETADQQGEEILSRRSDAWCRLLATFRAVYGGVEHDSLRLPAYGGNLFDPDRFPFLEGRSVGTHWRESKSEPLPINNQVILHLLAALQILQVKVPGGKSEPRRLSFSALGVEQIGHVYEGLLDHAAVRAKSPVLGLIGSKNQEPEVELAELEQLKQEGQEALVDYLKKLTERQANTLKRSLDAGNSELSDQSDRERLLQACNNDAVLCERVSPFAKLLRLDTRKFPVVIPAGNIYVTRGSERRSSGTYYTPPLLTEPIVKHALDPLVYIGPAEGLPETEWRLKPAKEILDLKVCDMAMGSGAFLVQVCRYLAEKLVEAWGDAEAKNPGAFIVTPEGELSTGSAIERLLPVEVDERILIARRFVADKCIYGVDKNDLAVNMAKLSLWLVTLQRDRPFTFLDHALKCGDSLLGVSTFKQIENFSLRPDVAQMTFGTANLFRYVEQAASKRRELEALPSNNYDDIETKNRLHAEAETATAKVKAIADHLIAFELRGLKGDAYDDERTRVADEVELLMKRDADAGIETTNAKSSLAHSAYENLSGRHPFHWPLEFPEVVNRGGFDAFVGNPPFLGGKRISTVLGTTYNTFLKVAFADSKGAADICAYFYRRANELLRERGTTGLLATNTIAQADTREVGLDIVIRSGGVIYHVQPSIIWPGTANVHVSLVHWRKGEWKSLCILGSNTCDRITPRFETQELASIKPHRLRTFADAASSGVGLMGMGFVLDSDLAAKWIHTDTKYSDVLWPYMNGQEFNNTFDLKPTRYAINFEDMSESEAAAYSMAFSRVTDLVKPHRDKLKGQIHQASYWKYWDSRELLYQMIKPLSRVLACAMVTKHLSFAFLPERWVYSQKLIVFPTDQAKHFSLLQCTFHDLWVRFLSPTLKSDLSYSVSDAFRTYPATELKAGDELELVGEGYHKFRQSIMLNRKEGLTNIYNRFHERTEMTQDIARLRSFHVEMDRAVARAYGWTDLKLDHGFHVTKQGQRFTIRESARREVLDRLLQLNYERYAEEERLGLHDKKRGKKKRKPIDVHQEVSTEQANLQWS